MIKRHGQLLLTIAAALWICFIWGHSLVPGDLSNQESGAALSLMLKLFHELNIDLPLTKHLIRKSAHFLEYMMLGVLLSGALGGWRKYRLAQLRRFGELMLLIPFLDETIQLFVAGRSGMIKDIWLDMAGEAAGALLVFLTQIVILHNSSNQPRQSAKDSVN